MISKDTIKHIIIDFQERIAQLKYIYRNDVFDESTNYVLVGLRRAGKSYTLFQHIAEQIKQGRCSVADILYINFEDERLNGFSVADFQTILICYSEIYPDRQPILYFDEIQIVDGWEKFARRVADQKYRVFITGSNAQMLSKEIATTLGGRYVPREIHPFSFAEYLKYKEVDLGANWEYSTRQQALVRSLFDRYFMYGGFAETFSQDEPREWLGILLKKILLGDIILRNNIRDGKNILLLQRKLAESVMQPTSQNHLCNVLKSTGAKITRNTIADYLDNMRDAFLLFGVDNFASNAQDRAFQRKTYFSDNGLLVISLLDAKTKLLENLVAVTLHNRYSTFDENAIFYYNKNIEVDFYIPSRCEAIQVCYRLRGDGDATFSRETKALLAFSRFAQCNKMLIITYDEEETIEIERETIEVVPIWKWVLRDSVGR